MKSHNTQVNVFLQPGDFHFADKNTRIETLLGSCVAITFWHPKRLIGGMCHYMLSAPAFRANPQQLNGKYAEDVITFFLQEIKAAGTLPSEYQAKIFGGGNMFTNIIKPTQCVPRDNCFNLFPCNKIGCKNTLVANQLVKKHGFQLVNYDIGGTQHRKVIFDISSGDVWLRKG